MVNYTLIKYDVFTNNIQVSIELKNIIREEELQREMYDNTYQSNIDAIQNSLYVNNTSYINRCVNIESEVQDYHTLLDDYGICTMSENITPFKNIHNIITLYTGPLIYNDQIYDYEHYQKFREDMKYSSYYDILESKIRLLPYRSEKMHFFHEYDTDPKLTYTMILYMLNYLVDLLSNTYSNFSNMLLNDETNPVIKAAEFSTQRTILENKITELKNNSKGIGDFKDLVLYAKNNLNIWFGYKTEVENKLLSKSDTIQTISSDTIYLSEEYYSPRDIKTDTNVYHLANFQKYVDENNILYDDVVFQKAYKMYISNQEIYLYEYAYYHNNIIIK